MSACRQPSILPGGGKSVVLLDRRGAGEETSYGNAGLIQREGVFPYGFPHDFGALFRYALNNTIDAHYHLRALPGLVPFLARYWWNSGFTPAPEYRADRYAPLIENSIAEHADLIDASGAGDLIRKDGWMKVFRTEKARDAAYKEAEKLSADVRRQSPETLEQRSRRRWSHRSGQTSPAACAGPIRGRSAIRTA